MVKKTNPNEKFKKLILTWWVWVIIAIVSYFIFASIPIQWTGEGLEEVEGTGGLKTFFAYLTQISWIIVVSLLIFSGIKAIQKSKIGDYWKISLTILGILGIIAYVIFSLSGMGIFDKLFYEHDERIGDLENEGIIKIHINLLEEDGYEVIYFGNLDVLEEGDKPYVKMKALGNRKTQVQSGLFSLSSVYPNAQEYSIRILEESQDCWHNINGTIHRALNKAHTETDSDKWNYYLENPEEYKESAVFIFSQYIDYQIDNPVCS